ncbi:MAG: 5-(carboxyamino)imidazole ribonucleotide synthase, partial [Hyphomicrobiaceae bacterium]|nr:5-(carboxyamino)imidazole ribonucleotide synthase [Hyphomicrobiaceae bacterium]
LDHIEAHCPVLPNRRALEVTQDRRIERDFLEELDISVANWAPVQRLKVLEDLVAHGLCPAILKTARLGYDGKGQARINQTQDAKAAFEEIGEQPAILEALVPFKCEISLLLVRNEQAEIAFYDCPQNHHVGGILHTSKVPAPLPTKLQKEAHAIGRKIADALNYVGLLTIELFVVEENGNSRLLVNEIAPRVHNSGHWTLDACRCDQFENHIRAVANWPLGSTQRHSNALMTNLLGPDVLDWPILASKSDFCVHLYGKQGAKKGRKLGHVTQLSPLDE